MAKRSSARIAGALLALLGSTAPLAVLPVAADSPEIPDLDLSRVDPAVREQLSDRRRQLDALLAQDPQPAGIAEALSLMGRLYLAYDYVQAGTACLEAAAGKAPGDFATQYLLGYAYDRQGQREAAKAAFERSLAAEPSHAVAHLRLGNLLLAQRQDAAAKARFEHAYRSDANCLGALYGLGEIARRSRDHEAAAGFFQQALDKAPDTAQVRYALGLALRRLGRLEEAESHLRQADWRRLNLGGWLGCADPLLAEVANLTTGAPAHLMRGAQAAFKGQPELELAEYRKAVTANPNDAVAQANLGSALYSRSELAEAGEHYAAAVRLDPDNATYRHDLGQVRLEQGSQDEALELLRSAARLEPRFKDAHLKVAGILLQKGRFEEAIEHCRSVIAVDPVHRQARVQLSMALLRLGRREEATAELGGLMDDHPPESPAERLQLATMLATLGDLDRALSHFTAVLSSARETEIKALAHTRIGQVRIGRGELPAAIESFRAALELEPEHPEAKALLARVLAHQGG